MSEHLQHLPKYLGRSDTIMNESLTFLFGEIHSLSYVNVLELGTRRWGDKPTHHRDLFPNARRYLMGDVENGEDVDIVVDAHNIQEAVPGERFNVVWASSVWEHLHSPWLAAKSVLEVLEPGGLFFIQTHLAFPEHGYPDDYFRFTRKGLERLFLDARELVSCYEYPADIIPRNNEIEWNAAAPNFLNVCLAGRK